MRYSSALKSGKTRCFVKKVSVPARSRYLNMVTLVQINGWKIVLLLKFAVLKTMLTHNIPFYIPKLIKSFI